MKDYIFINKAKALAITGHRVIPKDFNKEKLTKLLITFVNKGFDTFLVGMALGFDTVCFNCLERIKTKNDIKIIACVPCSSQAYKFTKDQKEEYERMLSVADEKILVSESYSATCMMKRNKYMVDNASCVLAYIKRDFGGTANTVKYAKKIGVPVVNYD